MYEFYCLTRLKAQPKDSLRRNDFLFSNHKTEKRLKNSGKKLNFNYLINEIQRIQ